MTLRNLVIKLHIYAGLLTFVQREHRLRVDRIRNSTWLFLGGVYKTIRNIHLILASFSLPFC